MMQLISLYTCNFIASKYKDRIWKNIRDNYVRALSGKKSGSGGDEIPQYPYLDAMSFLKPYVNIRAKNAESNFQPSQVPILTNQSSTDVDNAFQPENYVQLVVELPSQNTVSGTALPETSTMEESATQKPTKKRSYASMSQKHVDRAIDVKILEYLSNINNGNKKSTGSLDAMAQGVEDAFGMIVAAQLRLLDHEAKALAMSKIQMVFMSGTNPQTSSVSNSPPIFATTSWQENE